MKLHRIQVKAFLRHPSGIELSNVIPVFHQWIRRNALDDLLIDVANYEHVQDGPGILLIAHEADYAVDLSGGLPGLLYTRKRSVPDTVDEALTLALQRLFTAATLLEEDPSLGGAYRFRTDELEIRFLDRLQVPNRAESLEVVRADVERVLKALYEVDTVDLEWTEEDRRHPFGVRVKLPSSPDTSTLEHRLQSAVPSRV